MDAGILGRGAALKRKLNEARVWATNACFVCVCFLIAHLLPKRRWYAAALGLCRFLARTAGRFAPTRNNVNSTTLVPRLLHRFLDILFAHHPYIPIPVRVEGEEILREYAALPGSFVCCTAHIPLVKLFLPIARRAIGEGRSARIIAREPVGNNEVSSWNDKHWKAIRTDHAVLLHSRSLLRQNGCLMLVIDKEQGEFISSNIFRFVGKMNSRILTLYTQLQDDGTILVKILLPPAPLCKSEAEIRANLDFVSENVRRIMQGESLVSASPIQLTPEDTRTGWRSRELNRIQLYSNAQLDSRIRRLQAMLLQPANSAPQRDILEERLSLMRLELETRVGV